MRSYEADNIAHRPRTRFFPFFASDQSDVNVTLYTYGHLGHRVLLAWCI